jgi:hypothetical protein
VFFMLDALDMIRRASSVPPALEEIIETAEDLRQAKAIGYIFKLSHRADTDDMQKWTVKESLKFVKAFAHPYTQKDIPNGSALWGQIGLTGAFGPRRQRLLAHGLSILSRLGQHCGAHCWHNRDSPDGPRCPSAARFQFLDDGRKRRGTAAPDLRYHLVIPVWAICPLHLLKHLERLCELFLQFVGQLA